MTHTHAHTHTWHICNLLTCPHLNLYGAMCRDSQQDLLNNNECAIGLLAVLFLNWPHKCDAMKAKRGV